MYDRIIIPGLIPSQVMSYVSLGMSRQEWIKFIVSAVAHYKLDLSKFLDRYRLIFDESWGLIFQAFLWKREAWETDDNSSGYGVGFMQIESSGSLAVLRDDVSSDMLCIDVVNDIMSKIKRDTVKECTEDFRRCFDPKPKFKAVNERLIRLVKKSAKERKRGILNAFVWAIDEVLKHDYESPEARSDAFTIPNQFLRIVEDMGATKHSEHSKVLSLLCSEKPGEMSKGLSSLEIAALIHELLKGKRSNAIVLSFLVFDLIRDKLPTNNTEEVDFILREAYRRLPEDEKILKYLQRLYERMSKLLSQHLLASFVMPYSKFMGLCGPEKIKRIAVLWEYNLVAGELEEMLRIFIEDATLAPPYTFSFDDRWNDLLGESEEYWRDVISRFEELADAVINDETYLSSFQSEKEYFLDLPSWFDTVERELNANTDLKQKFKALLITAGSVGEAIRFNGKTVKVLKKPTATHPLIARGAFYEWLRTFTTLWR